MPDLEGIAHAYLACLEKARNKPQDPYLVDNHQWMSIELVDQLVRHQSGGEMLKLWSQRYIRNEDFIEQRLGQEYLTARKFCIGRPAAPCPQNAQQVGAFRLGGEPHLWMYALSLSRALHSCKFKYVQQVTPTQSAIVNFAHYELDADGTGLAHKPDSLYIEAAVTP